MAVTDDTQSMINYLVYRHGLNETADRARLLAYLQASEESVWAIRDWWFRQEEDTVQTAVGTATYTINEPCNNVSQMALDDGTPIEYFPPETFNRLLAPYTSDVGTPKAWTMLPKESQGTCRISMYPAPSSVMDMRIVKERRSNILSDDQGSQSALPKDYRMVVVVGAELQMMRTEGQLQAAQEKEAEYQRLLAALIEEDSRQTKVFR